MSTQPSSPEANGSLFSSSSVWDSCCVALYDCTWWHREQKLVWIGLLVIEPATKIRWLNTVASGNVWLKLQTCQQFQPFQWHLVAALELQVTSGTTTGSVFEMMVLNKLPFKQFSLCFQINILLVAAIDLIRFMQVFVHLTWTCTVQWQDAGHY